MTNTKKPEYIKIEETVFFERNSKELYVIDTEGDKYPIWPFNTAELLDYFTITDQFDQVDDIHNFLMDMDPGEVSLWH